MNFLKICINELINAGEKPFQRQNKLYFTLNQLKILPIIIKKIQTFSDLKINPYYLFDNNIVEPYEYALSICVVKEITSKINYFLSETGKKDILEINKNILILLDNTYYEVLENDIDSFIVYLKKYLNFISNKENIIIDSFRKNMKLHNIKFDGIFYELT